MSRSRRPLPLSRISIRLLLFNLLLVFLPVAGLLYLNTFEDRLLAAQERSMVQQGRMLAAALASEGPTLRPATERTLLQLGQRLTARLRVVDAEGNLLADSSRLGPRREPGDPDPYAEEEDAPRGSRLYRFGAAAFRVVSSLLSGPRPEPRTRSDFYPPGEPLLGPEIRAALDGRYGAATRRTRGQRSLTLYSAIPVVSNEGEITGAVLVSQSTIRLLQDLYEIRLAIFKVFLTSVGVAVVLSLLFATTIARPLERLRREAADLLDRRGRLRGRFGGSKRWDEIGALARALEDLSGRLAEHQAFTEAFAADLSHEFKNPLASIRTATEMLSEVEDPAERERFLRLAQTEVARLERLLTSVREITAIDAGLVLEERQEVDLVDVLTGLLEAFRLRTDATFELLPDPAPSVLVEASPDRLAQVFENLLDNAASFSPPGGRVRVRLLANDDEVLVTVSDEGPGIPPEHLERIFSRFFSYRTERGEGRSRRHSGLGLAIVRAIVEGYGGRISASNLESGGASFLIRLPLAPRPGV